MTLRTEILQILETARRPLAQAQVYAQLPRPVSKNAFAVAMDHILFRDIKRRRAPKGAREKYGARWVYWSKHARSRKRRWRPADDRALRTLYPHMRTQDVARIMGRGKMGIYRRAGQLGIEKSEAFKASPLSGRLVKGHADRGVEFRFQKGHVSANKGLRRPGYAPGRSAETQFKPGEISKRWDPEIYCIGALRINADGCIDMKVKEGARSWRQLHVMLWEDAHGEIPVGYVLRFKDGDTLNVCIENLELISRADLMRRNSIHNLPKPLTDSIQLLGQLKRRIHEKQDRRSA